MQKLKVILVVVGLLLIGFTGGFLTNRYLVKQKVNTLRRIGEGRGFGELFIKKIKATDEQDAQLREVFEIYGPRFKELGAQQQRERANLADSLFQELTPLLSEEQVQEGKKWRRMLERAPRRPKHGPQKHASPKE